MDDHIAKLAAEQDGVISTEQLARLGIARSRQRWMVESGRMAKAAPQVFRLAGSPDTHRQRLRTGLLSLGPASWVSFEAAAALHRLDRSQREAVEFTIPRSSGRPALPFDVHTSMRISRLDQVEVDGFRVLSATRTVLDLALARRPRERIEAAIDSAVRLGLSSPIVIADRLESLRGSGRWGCRLLDDLVVDSGGHSPLERRFLKIVREAGLGRPLTQIIHRRDGRHVARVDFLFADADLVVEVSGQHGHSSPTDRLRDAQRRNELQDLGRTVYEFTYAAVMHQPQRVIQTLRRRLALA